LRTLIIAKPLTRGSVMPHACHTCRRRAMWEPVLKLLMM
jgi:hypothetical protein